MQSVKSALEPTSILAFDLVFDRYLQGFEKSKSRSIKKKLSFEEFFQNKMLLTSAIRQGIPYDLFEKIEEITPFSKEQWAEYLNLSKKTLQRHKAEKDFHFKPIHSEKIIELAEVTHLGIEVFGSMEKFCLWLNQENFSLENLKPLELLKDSYGKELVMAQLNRIAHGIFV